MASCCKAVEAKTFEQRTLRSLRKSTVREGYEAALPPIEDESAAARGPLEAERGELKRCFTRRAARRTGASRAILSHVESWARSEGYSRLVLETGSRSDAAIALYTSHGFAPCGAFGAYRATEDNVFYEKSIVAEELSS